MANDNHLLSVPCYNGTMLKQDYYNEFFEIGQQKINFSFFELSLPDDDPVYTLKKQNIYNSYSVRKTKSCGCFGGTVSYGSVLFLLWTNRFMIDSFCYCKNVILYDIFTSIIRIRM